MYHTVVHKVLCKLSYERMLCTNVRNPRNLPKVQSKIGHGTNQLFVQICCNRHKEKKHIKILLLQTMQYYALIIMQYEISSLVSLQQCKSWMYKLYKSIRYLLLWKQLVQRNKSGSNVDLSAISTSCHCFFNYIAQLLCLIHVINTTSQVPCLHLESVTSFQVHLTMPNCNISVETKGTHAFKRTFPL